MIDTSHLATLFDNDEEMVRKFIQMLKTELPRSVTALRLASDLSDLKSIEIVSHQVKSHMKYLGQNELAQLSEQIELKSNAEAPVHEIRSEVSQLIIDVEHLLVELG